MLSRFKRKTREKIQRAFVWGFLIIFVFSVAAGAIVLATSNSPAR